MNVKRCIMEPDPRQDPKNWPDPCDPNAKPCSQPSPTKPLAPPDCMGICIEKILNPFGGVTKTKNEPCMPALKPIVKLKKACPEKKASLTICKEDD